ncbi:NAD(P)-dependent oxidoreductase [Cohnella nanjingensis]|uniref:NAD(P)H-binding protein n=1 Tax=Cohnella nanjingensis TaxID=1387779 RepID=A0A7X0RP12_9BACL|nr:NAD(P)H-binding protein [Cohnella nanjingensis]MBB6669765.1 NAD(P)H-binding protein [Cohnella nanjingensis]
MKIAVFGATGNIGRRVLAAGVERGHEMTAFVRNPEKLLEQQGERIASQTNVIAEEMLDPQSVYRALAHQDAAILAAGTAGDGDAFVRLVDNIVTQCERQTLFAGRVWAMGGAGLLTVPHTSILGNDLPGMPPVYKNHDRNLDRLRRTELDWSIMCPGTMVDASPETSLRQLAVSTESLPLPFPESTRELSPEELTGLIFSRFSELNVAYEDVAAFMLDHLERSGPYKGKRVGVAYPSA